MGSVRRYWKCYGQRGLGTSVWLDSPLFRAEVLAPATVLFPKEWLVPYNLACYACQLGKQDKARAWLKNAFDLGHSEMVKTLALADPNLEPLWEEIEEI